MRRNSVSVKFSCLVMLFFCFASGCSKKTQEGPAQGNPVHTDESYVSFRISVSDMAVLSDDGQVNDINIYVYREGRLENALYTEKVNDAGLYLDSGKEYAIYALANVGKSDPPEEESSLKEQKYGINGAYAFRNGYVPMSASGHVTVEGAFFPVGIRLVRNVAKIGLKIEAVNDADIDVKSVRLAAMAAYFIPFSANCSAEAVIEEAFSLSEAELLDLEAGKMAYMFVPENCQGIVFPGNADSKIKSPDNLPEGKAGLCTYIETEIVRDDASVQTLRFCLGQDAVSDCNIVRNTYTKVSLVLTGVGPEDYVWQTGDNGVPIPGMCFVAAGSSGSVLYTDTQGELISTQIEPTVWRDIVYADGKYVMAGDKGYMAFSNDGMAWNSRNVGQADWKALVYGNGLFIAAGYREYSVTADEYPKRIEGSVAVSSDGENWEISEFQDCCLLDAAYGNGRLLLSGYRKSFGDSHVSGRFFLSDDASRWTEYSVPSRYYPCLIYGNDTFVAMNNGTVIFSSDGQSWSDSEFTGSVGIDDMAYGGGTYVAAGRFGTMLYSLDGHGWEKVETPSDSRLNGVTFSDGNFIAYGKSGALMFSSDGKQWEKIGTGQTYDLYCACMRYQ